MVTDSRSFVGQQHGLGGVLGGLLTALRGETDHSATAADLSAEQARYHLGRARRALDHADYQRASVEAAKAVAADPHSPWPLITHGRAALASGHAAEAVGSLRLASRRAPNNRYVEELLIDAYRQAGHEDEAERLERHHTQTLKLAS